MTNCGRIVESLESVEELTQVRVNMKLLGGAGGGGTSNMEPAFIALS